MRTDKTAKSAEQSQGYRCSTRGNAWGIEIPNMNFVFCVYGM